MREIKFRGKRIDNNEWIKGQLLFFKDSVGKKNMARIAGGCEWNNETDWYNLCDIHRVKEETIGQYTGLHDKNGTEIYEGDVIEFKKYPSRKYQLVGFKDGAFMTGRSDVDCEFLNTYLWILKNHITVVRK